jgi:hypothetical protein
VLPEVFKDVAPRTGARSAPPVMSPAVVAQRLVQDGRAGLRFLTSIFPRLISLYHRYWHALVVHAVGLYLSFCTSHDFHIAFVSHDVLVTQ